MITGCSSKKLPQPPVTPPTNCPAINYSALEETPIPQPEGRTPKDAGKLLADLYSALGQCNVDKESVIKREDEL